MRPGDREWLRYLEGRTPLATRDDWCWAAWRKLQEAALMYGASFLAFGQKRREAKAKFYRALLDFISETHEESSGKKRRAA